MNSLKFEQMLTMNRDRNHLTNYYRMLKTLNVKLIIFFVRVILSVTEKEIFIIF